MLMTIPIGTLGPVMAIEKKSKKNTTSVNLSLRLDPRSKYLIDLMARHQKRTITGVIEWAVVRVKHSFNWHDQLFTQGTDWQF